MAIVLPRRRNRTDQLSHRRRPGAPRWRAGVERLLGARTPRAGAPGAGAVRLAPYGAWMARHQLLLRCLALVALGWGAVYLGWRIAFSAAGAQPVLWLALLLCELYGMWSLGIQTWYSWRRPGVARPAMPTDRTGLQADIYVCTYNEPVEVLTATLVGCERVAYPHTTYVLDDGRRPEVRALADRLGAQYLTRSDNAHAKAGNINAALPRTGGDLVLVLDADHVPMPDALDAMVGYFADDTVALVQSPHDFYNQDSLQHYDAGRHEQSVFYEVVLPGKDRHGAAFWCGSGALLRRAALLQVGGVATETIAEDFHTTLRLHSQGWTTRYHDEVLVQGLAPHDLASYLLQRDRWARGNLAVFTTAENPLRVAGLTGRQRLSYLGSLSAYLAGPVRLLVLGVLAVTLWTGWLPMSLDPWALAALWAPSVALCIAGGSALSRGWMRVSEAVHFEQLTGWIYLRSLRCAVRPGRASFRVTPKQGTDTGGWAALRQLRMLAVLGAAIGVGAVVRAVDWLVPADLLPAVPGVAVWLLPLLGLIELRRVTRSLYLVGLRRQRRREFRFPTQVPVVVQDATGQLTSGTTVDVSTGGASLLLAAAPHTSDVATVSLLLGGDDDGPAHLVRLEARLLDDRLTAHGTTVRVEFCDPDADAVDALAAWCYVVTSHRRLRGYRPAAPELDTVPAGDLAAGLPQPELRPGMHAQS